MSLPPPAATSPFCSAACPPSVRSASSPDYGLRHGAGESRREGQSRRRRARPRPVLTALKPDVCFNALHGALGRGRLRPGRAGDDRHPLYPLRRARLGAGHGQGQVEGRARGGRRDRPGRRIVQPLPAAAERHVMEPPYVVKPNAEGSSVGVFLVFDGANRPPQELVAPSLRPTVTRSRSSPTSMGLSWPSRSGTARR